MTELGDSIKIVLDGDAVPAERPRFARIGNFVKTYNPAHVMRYRTRLAEKAAEAMQGRNPMDGPLAMRVLCVMPMPASMPKKLRALIEEGAIVPHTKKPDGSNLLKNFEDALNSIVYVDDARLADVRVRKIYGTKPRIEVTVGRLPDPSTATKTSIPLRSKQPGLFGNAR